RIGRKGEEMKLQVEIFHIPEADRQEVEKGGRTSALVQLEQARAHLGRGAPVDRAQVGGLPRAARTEVDDLAVDFFGVEVRKGHEAPTPAYRFADSPSRILTSSMVAPKTASTSLVIGAFLADSTSCSRRS